MTVSITDQLQADLTTAMKARDQVATSTLRMLRTAIMNAEVAGDEARTLSDDEVIGVLQSEAKKRAESAQIYTDAGRDEAAATERAELAVIEQYLPAKMGAADLEALVDAQIAAAAKAGATGPKAMGQVIKAVRAEAGAAADGGAIAALVKSKLT